MTEEEKRKTLGQARRSLAEMEKSWRDSKIGTLAADSWSSYSAIYGSECDDEFKEVQKTISALNEAIISYVQKCESLGGNK